MVGSQMVKIRALHDQCGWAGIRWLRTVQHSLDVVRTLGVNREHLPRLGRIIFNGSLRL